MTFSEWWYDYKIKNGKNLRVGDTAKAAWEMAFVQGQLKVTNDDLRSPVYVSQSMATAGKVLDAKDAGWNEAIEAAREACIEVGKDAHEAAKAKDATDYVAGYQDASVDCDEALRDLLRLISPESTTEKP